MNKLRFITNSQHLIEYSMRSNSIRSFVPHILLASSLLLLSACERKPPTFVAKEAKAPESVQHYDLMKDQSQYLEYRKGDHAARAEAFRQMRIAEERSRGIYRKQSRWDY